MPFATPAPAPQTRPEAHARLARRSTHSNHNSSTATSTHTDPPYQPHKLNPTATRWRLTHRHHSTRPDISISRAHEHASRTRFNSLSAQPPNCDSRADTAQKPCALLSSVSRLVSRPLQPSDAVINHQRHQTILTTTKNRQSASAHEDRDHRSQ